MKLTTLAQDERLRTQLARVLDLSGAAGRAAAPVVDLLVRLALAKAFFALGMFPGRIIRADCSGNSVVGLMVAEAAPSLLNPLGVERLGEMALPGSAGNRRCDRRGDRHALRLTAQPATAPMPTFTTSSLH